MEEKNLNAVNVNVSVLLEYFNEKSKVYQCSSLWSKYSMIKRMLLVKKDVDISSYRKVVSFLKHNSVGHEAKKAKVLSKENVIDFIADAPDDTYLMTKVALVFGIYGALTREELTNMSVNDIDDRSFVLVVTIPNPNTNKKRVFTIVDDDAVAGLVLYKKYAALRPSNTNISRFFLQYRKNICTIQPVRKNAFGAIPKTVAKYLQLLNPECYTLTFRRTSATLLSDSGTDITYGKMKGGRGYPQLKGI